MGVYIYASATYYPRDSLTGYYALRGFCYTPYPSEIKGLTQSHGAETSV